MEVAITRYLFGLIPGGVIMEGAVKTLQDYIRSAFRIKNGP